MPRRVETASVELEEHRGRMRGRALVAACAALAAAPCALVSPRLALVMGVAAGSAALLAACSFLRLRGLVRELALDPDAYLIADVRRYGARMVEPRQRRRLARSLLRLRADAAAPQSLVVRSRVARCWPELEALARELASPEHTVEPTSAVACYELLTNSISSPLYNPLLPDDELTVNLHHIRAGIHRREPDGDLRLVRDPDEQAAWQPSNRLPTTGMGRTRTTAAAARPHHPRRRRSASTVQRRR